ncbi:MAG: glutamine synthetase family protein [Desulfomonilia bacterium]|nr:glutamine synthetase family protein [Desulfomonilia bacterium]
MVACSSRDEVFTFVREKKVSFIQLWFTDVLGRLKSFSITPDVLEEALDEGMGFDGSSIEGFARIEESDMIARPDPATFQLIPWRPDDLPVARMFCDIVNPDGSPYEGCSRHALKRVLAKASAMGFTSYLGPELEYFYFASDHSPEILDRGGYYDGVPVDRGLDLKRETIFALQKMGIKVEYCHHEVAPSQHEIALKYAEALTMADTVMTYRTAVKEIARKFGVYATFMPKPIGGLNGSGMHVHQSLFTGGENAFFDSEDPYQLSTVARHYIAGILRHAREITAVNNQWINSYKRLVPGFEAPVYVSWARRNRSTMVRVPLYKPGKAKATRMEFRAPDPACNPYLAFAVQIASGLKGIEERYPLPDPIEEDIFEMDEKARERAGIVSLPGNLFEATLEVSTSELVKDTLGDHIFEKFVENKKKEWDQFRTHVSAFEIERYLPVL